MRKKRRTLFGWMSGGLGLCFLFTVTVAVSFGGADIGIGTSWKALGHFVCPPCVGFQVDESAAAIIGELRLPRVLTVALVGAALSIAGVVYQALLKNPLADPYILGVSSGAAAGAVLAIVTGWVTFLGIWFLPAMAFAGALVALFLALRLAKIGMQLKAESLILSGVVVQAFFGAILTFALSLSPEEMQRIQFWLLGGFNLSRWEHVWIVLPALLGGFAVCLAHTRELNLFGLGDAAAYHLGVSTDQLRLGLLVTVSIMTSVAVSVSGMIGFVGLVIPHVMRMLIGGDHRLLLPFAGMLGAIFLVWADLLARTVLAPAELPIGVITAMTGAPFFAYLLRRHQKKRIG